MAVVHGSLAPFEKGKESWENYTERLDFYFQANGIADAVQKRSILLSVCGAETFEILRSLVSPGKLTDKPYNDLVAAMNRHINPPSSKIRYRYELFSSTRQPGESIASFVTRLQSIGQYCAYGDATAEMLKDAFVFGINDVQVQRRLFQEKEEFSLQTAIEIATTMELSAKDASRIHAKPSLHQASQHVHRVDDKKPKDPVCYRCGGSHLAPSVSFHRSHLSRVWQERP